VRGTRRALDADGWDSDVSLLRKQLAAVERRLLQTRLAARLHGAAEPGDTLLASHAMARLALAPASTRAVPTHRLVCTHGARLRTERCRHPGPWPAASAARARQTTSAWTRCWTAWTAAPPTRPRCGMQTAAVLPAPARAPALASAPPTPCGAPAAGRRGAAAVLAAELRRLGGRLGALDARARGARRGGQENRGLPALPPG